MHKKSCVRDSPVPSSSHRSARAFLRRSPIASLFLATTTHCLPVKVLSGRTRTEAAARFLRGQPRTRGEGCPGAKLSVFTRTARGAGAGAGRGGQQRGAPDGGEERTDGDVVVVVGGCC